MVVMMKWCSEQSTSGCLKALHRVLRSMNASFDTSERDYIFVNKHQLIVKLCG